MFLIQTFLFKKRKKESFPVSPLLTPAQYKLLLKVHECQPMCFVLQSSGKCLLSNKRLFPSSESVVCLRLRWRSGSRWTVWQNCFWHNQACLMHVQCCTRSQFDRNPGERLSNLVIPIASIPATTGWSSHHYENHARIVWNASVHK